MLVHWFVFSATVFACFTVLPRPSRYSSYRGMKWSSVPCRTSPLDHHLLPHTPASLESAVYNWSFTGLCDATYLKLTVILISNFKFESCVPCCGPSSQSPIISWRLFASKSHQQSSTTVRCSSRIFTIRFQGWRPRTGEKREAPLRL